MESPGGVRWGAFVGADEAPLLRKLNFLATIYLWPAVLSFGAISMFQLQSRLSSSGANGRIGFFHLRSRVGSDVARFANNLRWSEFQPSYVWSGWRWGIRRCHNFTRCVCARFSIACAFHGQFGVATGPLSKRSIAGCKLARCSRGWQPHRRKRLSGRCPSIPDRSSGRALDRSGDLPRPGRAACQWGSEKARV